MMTGVVLFFLLVTHFAAIALGYRAGVSSASSTWSGYTRELRKHGVTMEQLTGAHNALRTRSGGQQR